MLIIMIPPELKRQNGSAITWPLYLCKEETWLYYDFPPESLTKSLSECGFNISLKDLNMFFENNKNDIYFNKYYNKYYLST